MTLDLFAADAPPLEDEALAPGAVVLRGFAGAREAALKDGLAGVTAASPFRHLVTPGGFRMSVAMTNCGELGWVSDRRGYRYDPVDPETGAPWPAMPEAFCALAGDAAARAGYPDFAPDACLVNRYEPGARLSMHQDRDEKDLRAPIVSVSLGLPAIFLWGGDARGDKARRVALQHGDVVVWGGPSRLRFHGVLALKEGEHPFAGALRINLTFRKVRA
ncbi:MAG TPA: DNA oxidative demethylase AlkB [Burkholderiaceae bacterium]